MARVRVWPAKGKLQRNKTRLPAEISPKERSKANSGKYKVGFAH